MCTKTRTFVVLEALPANTAVVVKARFREESSDGGTLKSEVKIIVECNTIYGRKYRLA